MAFLPGLVVLRNEATKDPRLLFVRVPQWLTRIGDFLFLCSLGGIRSMPDCG
jgi:hypothetical protein